VALRSEFPYSAFCNFCQTTLIRAKVPSLSEWKRFDTLTADLAGDPARAARQLQTPRIRIDGLISRLVTLKEAVADHQVDVLRASAAAFKVARDAASAASADLFSGEPLPEIGSETWKALWEAARAYSQTAAYPEQLFPVTDAASRCVLCHQELSAEAADRLKRFEAFIKDARHWPAGYGTHCRSNAWPGRSGDRCRYSA
jgi:hypothetical protein